MSVCLNLKSVCKKSILVQSIRPPKQAFNGYNLLTNSGYSKRKSEVDFVRQGCIVSCNSATIYILSNEWEVGCDAEVEKQKKRTSQKMRGSLHFVIALLSLCFFLFPFLFL